MGVVIIVPTPTIRALTTPVRLLAAPGVLTPVGALFRAVGLGVLLILALRLIGSLFGAGRVGAFTLAALTVAALTRLVFGVLTRGLVTARRTLRAR